MRQVTQGQRRLIRWFESGTLNQRNIAKLLNISEPHLSQILSGDKGPSLSLAARLEKLTDIPIRSWADKWVSYTDQDDSGGTVSDKQTKARGQSRVS